MQIFSVYTIAIYMDPYVIMMRIRTRAYEGASEKKKKIRWEYVMIIYANRDVEL